MRVALNLEQLLDPPGGIHRYVAALARLLPGARLDGLPRRGEPGPGERVELVPFVARHPVADVARALEATGLERLDPVVARLPRPMLYDSWNVLGRPLLSSESPRLRDIDVIHAPSVAVPPRQPGAALVVSAHDAATLLYPETSTWRGRRFHRQGLAAAAKRADLVITGSAASADELVESTAIPRDRLRVVHHGVTVEPADPEAVAGARLMVGLGDEPYVLWVGALEPRKNVGVLVEAFSRLVAAHPGATHKLVLVGPRGWLDAADTVARAAAELGDRVVMPGPVVSSTLRGLYAGASVFAFPSIHEGFGIPVLEAMAQGTPVVCSDIPPLVEVGGDVARYVAPDDPEAWAHALEEVLAAPPDPRGERADVARVRAAQFSEERFAAATLAVYREAIELARSH